VSQGWTRYYDAAGVDPRPTVLAALERFDRESPGARFAVDLGCGTGRDTLELLRRGWRVLAIDSQAEAIERAKGCRGGLRYRWDNLEREIPILGAPSGIRP